MSETILQRIRERAVPLTEEERRFRIVEHLVSMKLSPVLAAMDRVDANAGVRLNGNYNHIPPNIPQQRATLRQFQ